MEFRDLFALGIPSLTAFALSLRRSLKTRFEAPQVFFSILIFARILGELALFAYGREGLRLIPFLENQCLPALAFYPLMISLLRFSTAAYQRKGLIPAAIPILIFDTLRIGLAYISGKGFIAAYQTIIDAPWLKLGLSGLGALGIIIFSLVFLFPKRRQA